MNRSIPIRYQLEIGAWNCNSFKQNINSFKYNKLENPFFLETVTKFKIFSLIETHHTADEIGQLHISGYKCHTLCRPKSKNVRKHKPSGGLAVYIHESITEGVKLMSEPGTESVIVQLCKEYFDLSDNIYICFTYLCPANSEVLKRDFMPDDLFDDLCVKIAKYRALGQVILMGDLNARTETLCDYLPEDIPENDLGEHRSNIDTSVNSYGRKFLDLCREVPLRILNGRFLGDLLGNLTSFNPRGSSCVDYAAVSPELLENVWHFSVLPLQPTLSDHCPISLGLRVGCLARQEVCTESHKLLQKPDKLVWNKTLKDSYCNIIQSRDVRNIVDNFVSVGILPDQSSVDSATSLLTDVMITAAKQAGMQMKSGVMPMRQARQGQGYDRPRARQPKWFDQSCHGAYQAVKRTAQLLSRSPRDPWLRGKIRLETKHYNRIVKYKQKQFVSSLFNDLEAMDRSDPKGYMDLVRSLKQGRFDRQVNSDTASVSPDLWFQHFKELLGKTYKQTQEEDEMEKFIWGNIDNFSSELDCPFTQNELQNSLKNLKNNKASGFDMICNEMLKCAGPSMEGALLLLFNTILAHNLYPKEFKRDICLPLFKCGIKIRSRKL